METTKPRYCRLENLRGRDIVCPGEACAFWEPGGTVLEGQCVLDGIDFAPEPGLADWLLAFRDALATPSSTRHDAGHEFTRALSEGRE